MIVQVLNNIDDFELQNQNKSTLIANLQGNAETTNVASKVNIEKNDDGSHTLIFSKGNLRTFEGESELNSNDNLLYDPETQKLSVPKTEGDFIGKILSSNETIILSNGTDGTDTTLPVMLQVMLQVIFNHLLLTIVMVPT